MSALRSLARFALVLSLAASTQGFVLTQAAFTLRRDVIAERLCVNRDRPERACHGRCQLTKRLHEERQRQQERQTSLLQVALAAPMLVATAPAVPLPVAPVREAAWAPGPDDAPRAGAPAGVFRPPRLG